MCDNKIYEGANMDTKTYRYFSQGLKRAIAEAGYKKGEFAKGIMHPVTLSNNLSDTKPSVMEETNRFSCAKKLGMDVQDIINLGKDMSVSIDGSKNVQTVAGRDITNGDRRRLSPDLEYFIKLFREKGDDEMLNQWIRELLDK